MKKTTRRIVLLLSALLTALSLFVLCACFITPDDTDKSRIEVKYDERHIMEQGESIESLRPYITVTYFDKNGKSTVVTDYEMGGSLFGDIYYIDVNYKGYHCEVRVQAKVEHTVTLNYNGATGGKEVETISVARGYPIQTLPTPTKTGFIFIGWCKDEQLQRMWDFEMDCVIADMTLYAKWISLSEGTQGLTYALNSDGNSYRVTGIGTATDTEIFIPLTYKDRPVTRIGGEAFKGCSSLTSIIIPDSVTSISSYAFLGCNKLASISYLGTIESWCKIEGLYALMGYGTSSKTFSLNGVPVTELVIPDTVTSIPSYAFRNTNITSVTIPDSVTSIDSNAFEDCNKLQYNEYDNALYLGNYTNKYLVLIKAKDKDRTSYTVNEKTKVIADSAFSRCSNLTSITIPDSVMLIGSGAYYGCSKLASINYLGTIESWCKIEGLYDLMGYGTSSKTFSLNGVPVTELVIPDTVTSISSGAFAYTNITSITIPDSVTSMGGDVFVQCNSLQYNEYDNALYLGNNNNKYVILMKAKDTSITSCTINENTRFIYQYAFRDCSSLTSIIIPDSVTSMGWNVFDSCRSLTSITIPNSVTSIGKYVFRNCSSLAKITVANGNAKYHSNGNCLIETDTKTLVAGCNNSVIPADGSVTNIGQSAFYGSSLTSITIPDSVTSIDWDAFEWCSKLVNINVTSIESWCKIEGLGNLMRMDYNHAGNITFSLNGVPVTELVIPDTVTSIPSYAFDNFTNITSVTIPNSVISIGGGAFDGCGNLTAVYYNGTAEDWSKINSGSDNSNLTYATRYYYSENEPALNSDGTAYDGNYWHYVDGVVTVWKKET